jgi:hypothetical protein
MSRVLDPHPDVVSFDLYSTLTSRVPLRSSYCAVIQLYVRIDQSADSILTLYTRLHGGAALAVASMCWNPHTMFSPSTHDSKISAAMQPRSLAVGIHSSRHHII